ncbi:MAG: secretion protein HlyD [Rhizobiales bacterium]|nr:secretion protein HlyD [Hyphomicrobiales bacterium]MBA68744.1 secretion protein HlyD [Hyphomicrobiales bacterium]
MKLKRDWISELVGAVLPNSIELARTMGQPVLVEETVPYKLWRAIGIGASAAILVGVAWASIARVNEVSVAVGSLVPDGFEQSVQHYEGGIVQTLHVKEGDLVEEGATLITLRDASTLEDGVTMERQRYDLRAQIEAQTALAENRQPDFSFVPASHFAVVQNNRSAHDAESATIDSQLRELDRQITQARLSLDVARTELEAASGDAESAQTEYLRFSNLLGKGVATKVQVNERLRAAERARANNATAASRVNLAVERLAEVEQQRASFVTRARSTTRQRILELESALTALEGNILKKEGRRNRLEVAAPIDGIIKFLAVRGPGEVVGAGEQLAVIVPSSGPLIAKTRVPASQIGYLAQGQEAHVKITAYDFTRFGWLSARIHNISPSAFQEEGRGSYYNVELALSDTTLARAPNAPILPGMELTADIITGEKTVLQYLLTPLQRTFGTAFGER